MTIYRIRETGTYTFTYSQLWLRGWDRLEADSGPALTFLDGVANQVFLSGDLIGGTGPVLVLDDLGPSRFVTRGEIRTDAGDAVRIDGDRNKLVNRGEISGDTGVEVSGSAVRLRNFGQIDGEAPSGIGVTLVESAAGAVVNNSGRIEGRRIGVQVESDDASVTNTGILKGLTALHVSGDLVEISNTGRIFGSQIGVSITGDLSDTDNTGRIVASTYGIMTEGGAIENGGVVRAQIALHTAGQSLVENKGALLGDVLLSGEDDTFVTSGRGRVRGEIRANDGDDRVFGGRTRDLIDGEAGDDVLAGGGGNDRLRGGLGRDTLAGEAGSDLLSGGADADVFRFWTRASGRDQITDFTPGEDRISFQGLGLTEADQARFLVRGIRASGTDDSVLVLKVLGHRASGKVTLRDVSPDELSPDDFLF